MVGCFGDSMNMYLGLEIVFCLVGFLFWSFSIVYMGVSGVSCGLCGFYWCVVVVFSSGGFICFCGNGDVVGVWLV